MSFPVPTSINNGIIIYGTSPRRRNLLLLYFFSSLTTTVFCGTEITNLFHLSIFGEIKNNDNNISNQCGTSKTSLIRKNKTSKTDYSSTINKEDNIVIGGGNINEKERQYCPKQKARTNTTEMRLVHGSNGVDDEEMKSKSAYNPMQHRSHLLHAIEGLDRYPNYISRWKEIDINSLEQALKEKLEQVREQKTDISSQRRYIQLVLQEFLLEYPEWIGFSRRPTSWDDIRNMLDPRAVNVIFRSKIFHRKNNDQGLNSNEIFVNDVISGRIPIELDAKHLQEWIDYEMNDVYSFPLLSKTYCRKIHTYVSSIISFVESTPRISNLPKRIYKDLDYLGLEWLNDLIFNLIVRPISAQLYKDTELSGGDLDFRQGYIASYSSDPTISKPRQGLVPHTDDAEVSTKFI